MYRASFAGASASDCSAQEAQAQAGRERAEEADRLHRLCCRLDAVVRTVQDAVSLGRACPSMVQLVHALDAAAQHLDCEALDTAAEAFEKAFPRHDLDNHTSAPAQPAPAASESTVSGEHDDDDDVSAGPTAARGSDGFARATPDRPGPDLVAERLAVLLRHAADSYPPSRSDSC